jgi:hypothetical protein
MIVFDRHSDKVYLLQSLLSLSYEIYIGRFGRIYYDLHQLKMDDERYGILTETSIVDRVLTEATIIVINKPYK